MSKLSKYLRKQKVKQLRLTWCDNANIIRARVFSIDAIDKINQSGIRISQALQGVAVMSDQVIAEAKLPMTQDILLKPDWLSFHVLPYSEASACVMSRMMDNAVGWALCPRQFLMGMMSKLFEKTGLTMQVGFDQAFQLFAEDNPLQQVSASSRQLLDKFDLFLTDLSDVLKTMNLQPMLFHAQAGYNRFNFSFDAMDPLAAADHQILFRQTVHGLAMKYQLRSEFLPMTHEEDGGNGGALHFNLYQNNKKATFNKEMLSDISSYFIAGILYHLPDLMALTTPTVNSLRRIRPKHNVGCYQVWGYDNRETPIEVPNYLAHDSSRGIVFKTVDASANPYLALSGVIACGIDGVEKKMLLPRRVEYDPSLLPRHDSLKPLPIELGEILKSVERSPFFKTLLGDQLFAAYIAVKKAEYEFFKQKTLAQEVALLRSIY